MSDEDLKQETESTSEAQDVEVQLEDTSEQPEASIQVSSEQSSTEEEELTNYSDKVQKRIKKLTEKYRREERDREEAVRMAKKLREENEELKQQMSSSQQAHLNEYGQRVENQLVLAKEAYKKAHEDNDTEKMFEAQQALSKISIEEERYRLAKNRQDNQQVQAPEAQQASQQASQQAPQPQEPDPKAKAWANKNEWFGQDEVMTYAAFGLHRKLVEDEGFDPSSDEYYDEIDSRLQKEFPHKFNTTGRSTKVAPADTSASRKPTGRSRTVKLTPSEVQMAKRLNVPLEEYAKYVQR